MTVGTAVFSTVIVVGSGVGTCTLPVKNPVKVAVLMVFLRNLRRIVLASAPKSLPFVPAESATNSKVYRCFSPSAGQGPLYPLTPKSFSF